MRSEWKGTRLGDVLGNKGYIRGPFGSALRRGELFSSGPIPVYEQQHAIYGDRNFRFFIDTDKYETLKRFTVQNNDIIISCSGTIGKASMITANDPKGIISQALLILRADTNMINPAFLLHFIQSREGFNAITSRSSGSVQVNIAKRETIENIPFLLPTLPEQQLIAATLSCLDDKIELSNKLNANLEAQAQAIFKSWFVDFEPFQDGEFVDSALGMIPKGWQIKPLTDIAQYLNGLAMQKYRPKEDEKSIPVLKIKELRQGKCDDSSELCSDNLKPEYIVNDGDVIFSWSGSLMVDIWCGGKCGLNQHLFKVTSNEYNKWFYYLWTKHYLEEFAAIAAGKATTMGHIKRSDMDCSLVLVPDKLTYGHLNNLLTPMIDQITQNRIQSRTLAAIRDALLPKLMSGEIEVPFAE